MNAPLLKSQCRADSDEHRQADPLHETKTVDPLVAEYVAQHEARKIFPSGHTVNMTGSLDGDTLLSIGTCDCGTSFSFPRSKHREMNASIEAHWQKFDHLPGKVDDKGHPIPAGSSPAVVEPAGVVANPAPAGTSPFDGDEDGALLRLAQSLAWVDDEQFPRDLGNSGGA